MTLRSRLHVPVAVMLWVLSLVPGLASQAPPTPSFAYVANPLDIKMVDRTVRADGIALEEFSFVAPTGRRLGAYMVLPPGRGPFAAVLYLHWLGDKSTSNRSEFLPEALTFAKEGVVSLLIDNLWYEEPFPWTGRDASHDRDQCVRSVIEARRALDLMLSHSEVDPARVAVVGHDFGAMAAAELAGVDDRVQSYVLMAGTPRYHYWFLRWSGLADGLKPAYIAAMSSVDPATLVAQAKGASFLFQFSRDRDEWVSPKEAREFYDAAKGPKQIMFYDDADHSLKSPKVAEDRLAWLRKQLHINF
jgi:fermentation-respiration switch protein FrsA (DUF1100 family)